jgi:hypothetical protein
MTLTPKDVLFVGYRVEMLRSDTEGYATGVIQFAPLGHRAHQCDVDEDVGIDLAESPVEGTGRVLADGLLVAGPNPAAVLIILFDPKGEDLLD